VFSDAVITTFLTVVGAVTTAYITYRIKNAKPKVERVDTALDVYESVVKRQDEENKRLVEENTLLRAEIAVLKRKRR